MKIRGEVKAVAGNGWDLTVQVLGREVGASEWSEPTVSTVTMRETESSKRAFHVGRNVSIEVKPL